MTNIVQWILIQSFICEFSPSKHIWDIWVILAIIREGKKYKLRYK
jgi:hypothetical protein